MRFSLFKIPLFLSLIILVCSCGDSSNSGNSGMGYLPKDSEKDVTYSINCEKGPLCNNPSRVGSWSSHSGNTYYIDCEWYCGNYKNYRRQDVDINFSKSSNECWKFDSESFFPSKLCS
jgi:hypothetical protein